MTTVLRSLDIPSILPTLVFDVYNVRIRGAEACVRLEGILFSKFVGSHISVQRASYSRSTPTAVVSVVPIKAASISSFPVSPLYLLVDKILKVLLPDLSLLVLSFVLCYMLF